MHFLWWKLLAGSDTGSQETLRRDANEGIAAFEVCNVLSLASYLPSNSLFRPPRNIVCSLRTLLICLGGLQLLSKGTVLLSRICSGRTHLQDVLAVKLFPKRISVMMLIRGNCYLCGLLQVALIPLQPPPPPPPPLPPSLCFLLRAISPSPRLILHLFAPVPDSLGGLQHTCRITSLLTCSQLSLCRPGSYNHASGHILSHQIVSLSSIPCLSTPLHLEARGLCQHALSLCSK